MGADWSTSYGILGNSQSLWGCGTTSSFFTPPQENTPDEPLESDQHELQLSPTIEQGILDLVEDRSETPSKPPLSNSHTPCSSDPKPTSPLASFSWPELIGQPFRTPQEFIAHRVDASKGRVPSTNTLERRELIQQELKIRRITYIAQQDKRIAQAALLQKASSDANPISRSASLQIKRSCDDTINYKKTLIRGRRSPPSMADEARSPSPLKESASLNQEQSDTSET